MQVHPIFLFLFALYLHLSVLACASANMRCPEYFVSLITKEASDERVLFEMGSQFIGEHEGKAAAFEGISPNVFVLYFNPEQAKDSKVEFHQGKFVPSPDSSLHHAMKNETHFLLVMGEDLSTYMGRPEKLKVHHSSFLGGAPVRFAGEAFGKYVETVGFEVEVLSNRTGHFLVTPGAMKRAIMHFNERGVNVGEVKIEGPVKSVIVSQADFLNSISNDCSSQILAIEQLMLFAPNLETRVLMRDNLVAQQYWNLVAARLLWDEIARSKSPDERAGHEFDLQDYLAAAKRENPKAFKADLEKLRNSIPFGEERSRFDKLAPRN